jgi:asparagine synthetase B (glutamine-hydrolysing)
MCGICGEVRTARQVSLGALERINGAMQSRGPDAAGVYLQGGMGFGHRRLSILDLSPAAQQPMLDAELGLPAEVIDRPKGYFPVPALRYSRGPLLDFVRSVLDAEPAWSRGLCRRDFVDHMLQHPEAEMSQKGHSRLWQAALLEAWLQTHGI